MGSTHICEERESRANDPSQTSRLRWFEQSRYILGAFFWRFFRHVHLVRDHMVGVTLRQTDGYDGVAVAQ